jgi:uncharacterized protein (DUF983 family)
LVQGGTTILLKQILILFGRGIRLACPVCGEGRLFRGWFKMYERCPVCGFYYEREEGYFTGAMAINLVISELLLAALAIPLALQPWMSLMLLVVIGATLAILFPILFYRHSKGLWMSIDHILHPVEQTE